MGIKEGLLQLCQKGRAWAWGTEEGAGQDQSPPPHTSQIPTVHPLCTVTHSRTPPPPCLSHPGNLHRCQLWHQQKQRQLHGQPQVRQGPRDHPPAPGGAGMSRTGMTSFLPCAGGTRRTRTTTMTTSTCRCPQSHGGCAPTSYSPPRQTPAGGPCILPGELVFKVGGSPHHTPTAAGPTPPASQALGPCHVHGQTLSPPAGRGSQQYGAQLTPAVSLSRICHPAPAARTPAGNGPCNPLPSPPLLCPRWLPCPAPGARLHLELSGPR